MSGLPPALLRKPTPDQLHLEAISTISRLNQLALDE